MGKLYLGIVLSSLFFSCEEQKKERHGGGKEFRIELYLENSDNIENPKLSNFNASADTTGMEGS